MGAAVQAPHLCRLFLPAGVFILLFLLYITSPRLPGLPHSACVWGTQPSPSHEEMPPDKNNQQTPTPAGTPSDAEDEEFQMQRLQSAFAASLAPGGDILVPQYLRGWEELIKLLDALGVAFRLVSSEARAKVSVLRALLAGVRGRRYGSLRAMVALEAGPGGRRGLRTLLRLHRALRWLQLFLRALAEEREAAPARLCAEAYARALAPFHGWWVRQAAALAFLALPARPELLRLACKGAGPDALRMLGDAVATLERVCDATQDVYAAHALLDLP